MITEKDLAKLLFTTCEGLSSPTVQGKSLSPGAGAGRILRTREDAAKLSANETGIYCCTSLSSEDLSLMGNQQVTGYTVETTDDTRHEVVILRASGKPLVGGVNASSLNALEFITIDGCNGVVCEGIKPLRQPDVENSSTQQVLSDLIGNSRITVRANADTPAQTRKARILGAKGLGPVRTEYMFYTEGRLPLMQRFILTSDDSCLTELAELQQQDFAGILKEMNDYPVGIRLFDPPFNEFTPKKEEDKRKLAATLGISYQTLCDKINQFDEDNPMLGTRGVRLGILRPEVYKMQLVAAFSAAADLINRGYNPKPDITVPFIAFPNEIEQTRKLIDEIALDIQRKEGVTIPYTVTAMIELPIACLNAGRIAEYVDGFSFGTNDLAQTTYGISRTDMGKTLEIYKQRGIISQSPFTTLDQGLLELLQIAIERGRKTNNKLTIGICGEQGAERTSAEKCIRLGMDYISCSPYRVPFVNLYAQRNKK